LYVEGGVNPGAGLLLNDNREMRRMSVFSEEDEDAYEDGDEIVEHNEATGRTIESLEGRRVSEQKALLSKPRSQIQGHVILYLRSRIFRIFFNASCLT
jgi:hypothetical protein